MAAKIPRMVKEFWNSSSFLPKDRRKRMQPNAPGIDDTTCKIKGDRSDCQTGPTPPPRRPLTPLLLSSSNHLETNLQEQSLFFSRLPAEIRRQIYSHLFGNRRIHIDYDYYRTAGRPGERWRWYHRVCRNPPLFPSLKETQEDRKTCGSQYREMCTIQQYRRRLVAISSQEKSKGKRWRQRKLNSVNWLRTCRFG